MLAATTRGRPPRRRALAGEHVQSSASGHNRRVHAQTICLPVSSVRYAPMTQSPYVNHSRPDIKRGSTPSTPAIHQQHVCTRCDWLWTPFKGSHTKTAAQTYRTTPKILNYSNQQGYSSMSELPCSQNPVQWCQAHLHHLRGERHTMRLRFQPERPTQNVGLNQIFVNSVLILAVRRGKIRK
jgi:hypothetical protein